MARPRSDRLLHRAFFHLLTAVCLAGCNGDETKGQSGGAGGGSAGGGGEGGSAGAAGQGGSGGQGGAGGHTSAPTLHTQCAGNDGLWQLYQQPDASIQFGVPAAQAEDNAVCELLFPGHPELGPDDRVSPAFATQIATLTPVHFGRYRARVRLAACAAGEEAVNGIFIYFNDGSDGNNNGLPDNTEIDIEILCGEPSIIYLTTWTDYDDATGSFLKWSRAVDLATGDIYESPSDHEYGLDYVGHAEELVQPGFPGADTFYELGFDWQPAELRFNLVIDDQELLLWHYQNATYIPQTEASFMFNVWHTAAHWFAGGAADYPALDATMQIDWFSYWAEGNGG